MKSIKLSNSEFEPREGYERSVLLGTSDFDSNTKVQLMRLAPGEGIKPHHHEVRTECFRIVSGEGKIVINGETVASSEDELVLCEPGDIHEFVNTSDTEPFTFLVIRTNDPVNEDMIWES